MTTTPINIDIDNPSGSEWRTERPEPNSVDKCDASRRWSVRALALETQHNDDQMTIALLRSIISELSEQLHAADSNARVSLTSSELLELIHGNDDTSDTPF